MMRAFTVLLATFSLASAQDSLLTRKCQFIKREMASGHKAYLAKQAWFPRLARACGFSTPEPFPAKASVPAAPAHAAYAISAAPRPLQDALGWAKSAINSKESAEIGSEATKLALKAKMAFEHQDSHELKEGAADFMGKLKDLWDKNANEEMKKKAAVLLNKAKQTLQAKGVEDLPAEAMAVGEQLKRKVEAVQENLAGSDLAGLASAAGEGNLQGKAAELVKMALNKPETELLAKKAAATLEKQVEKQMENLKAAGLDEKALQAFAQKAGTKLGAIHV